jgi:PAS domain S-box-containing protein
MRHEHSNHEELPALAGRLALLEAVVEGLPHAIFVKDRQGRYLFVNGVTAQFVGKQPAEMLGHDDSAFFTPETAAAFSEVDRRVMNSGVSETVEGVGASLQGASAAFRTTKAPLLDASGAVAGVIGISRDITEGKRREERMWRTQELLTGLLENLPANVFVNGADGRRRLVNRAWEKTFGLSRHDVLGKTRGEALPPRLAEQSRLTDERVIATGAPVVLDELFAVGGTMRWFHTVKFPLRDAEGNVDAVGGIALDVTERRQAEDAARQHAERLQALSQRLVEVQEQERSHLARELHDEIGQLLTSLKFALTGGKTHEAQALLEEALAGVRELSFNLRPALLDHLGLVPALSRLIERYSDSTGVRVTFRHSGLEQRLAAQVETVAYRVVQEALTNVARHARAPEAAVRLWVDAGMLEIQIEDQGIGFELNEVLDGARSSGLPGMRERVQLVGGRLEIEAAPGSGTHLLAVLPALAPGGGP